MTYEAPDLDFEMTYTVRTTHPLEPTVGSPFGAKQFWQVSEATLDGARIKAHLAGAGLDWMSVGSDGFFAFGNSDGDKEMFEWTAAGVGLCFVGIVHHTDATREWAYDRESEVGRLDKVLDQAKTKGWIVVDMKNDWTVIFPPAMPSCRNCSS